MVTSEAIRLLVVARHPVRLEDLGIDEMDEVESAALVRRPGQMATALEESSPHVVLVDCSYSDDRGYDAMEEVPDLAPQAAVLALTPDPPPHDAVARSANAGARGFVDVDVDPPELLAAIRAVNEGGLWFPPEATLPILRSVGGSLEMTSAERRSRLTGILIGLVPLTGLLAALMAFLWRRYTGQIGVRPVDIAVDPASRIVDAFVMLSMAIGAFGPLLFVGNWLNMIRASPMNRGPLAWILERHFLAHLTLSLIVLGCTAFLAIGPDLLLVVVIGPLVTVAVIARAADLGDQVPAFLRIEASPRRVLIVGSALLFVVLAAVGGEALMVGPQLGTRGEGGLFVPRILGFNAQPVLAHHVDSGEARELLYLGGNADLYVLVDPCNDNNVEYVSVGAHRLEVIDEISCTPTG